MDLHLLPFLCYAGRQHPGTHATALLSKVPMLPGGNFVLQRHADCVNPYSVRLRRLAVTPDGNFTVTLGPGASEGRVDFTALVEWPTNLVPFTPCEGRPLAIPGIYFHECSSLQASSGSAVHLAAARSLR